MTKEEQLKEYNSLLDPDLQQRILDFIKEKNGGVSFVELSRIDGVKGDYAMHLGKYENIILWNELSKEAIVCLTELVKIKKIKPKNTQLLVYAVDGMTLRLPLAKRVMHYKKPRWMPVTFDLWK